MLLKQFDELSDQVYRADLALMLFNGSGPAGLVPVAGCFLWLGALQVSAPPSDGRGTRLLQRSGAARQRSAVVTIVMIWDMLQHTIVLARSAQRHPRAGARAGCGSFGIDAGEIASPAMFTSGA